MYPFVLFVERVWHFHEEEAVLHYHGAVEALSWTIRVMFSVETLPWTVMFIVMGAILGLQYNWVINRMEKVIAVHRAGLNNIRGDMHKLKTDFVGLELIRDVNIALNLGKGLEEVLQILNDGLTSVFGYNASALYLIDEDGEHATLISYSTDAGIVKKIEKLIGIKFLGYKAHIIEGDILSSIITTKKPVVSSDLAEVVRVQAHAKNLSRFAGQIVRISGMKYGVGAPLTTSRGIIGVIGVASKKPIRQEDVERLTLFAGWAAMAVDRAKVDKKLKQTNEELLSSNHTKDLFIDIIRHDLLNPACVVRNLSEMALNEEDGSLRAEMLGEVLRNSEGIIEMVENASTLASIESGDELVFDMENIGQIARSAVEDVQSLAGEKNITIKPDVDRRVMGNVSPTLKNVFTNLITNAIKYSPGGSSVYVSLVNEGDVFRFTVEDEGPGIPDEHKENIFNRFTRLKKEAVQGTGLGLAIVKKVVELHNGRVFVVDREKGGSIFHVEIPIERGVRREKRLWRVKNG